MEKVGAGLLFLGLAVLLIAAAPLPLRATVQLGSDAPDFELPLLAGGSFHLADAAAQGPVLVAFFRTVCSHCVEELPVLDALSKLPAFAGVQILAVSVKESAEAVQALWAQAGLTLPVALDADMSVARRYGVAYVPRLVFVRQGGLVVGITGALEEGELRERLAKVLAPADVLLVIPDGRKASGLAVLESAIRAGYQPRVWALDESGPPTAEVLSAFAGKVALRSVVSDAPGHVIGAAEVERWLDFLFLGGNLLVAGNDAFRTLGQSELATYALNVRYQGDDAGVLALHGAPGSDAFAALQVSLVDKTEETGPVTPDVLEPFDAAVGVLAYGATPGAGRPQGFGGVLTKT